MKAYYSEGNLHYRKISVRKALRKVAIIISRKGADKHAKMAARGSLRESGN